MPQDQDFALFSKGLTPDDLPVWRVADGNVEPAEVYAHLPLMAAVRRDGHGVSHLHMLLLVVDDASAPLGTVLCSQQLASPLGRIYAASLLTMLGWDGRVWPQDEGYPSGTGMEPGIRDAMGAINAKAAMVFPPAPGGDSEAFRLYPLPVRHSRDPWTLLIKVPVLGPKDPRVLQLAELTRNAQVFGLMPPAPVVRGLTPGRNDPCPCGKREHSLVLDAGGRATPGARVKFKACHGRGAAKPSGIAGRNGPCPCGKKDARGRRPKFKACCGDPLAGQREQLEALIAARAAKEGQGARTTLASTDQESAILTEASPPTGEA